MNEIKRVFPRLRGQTHKGPISRDLHATENKRRSNRLTGRSKDSIDGGPLITSEAVVYSPNPARDSWSEKSRFLGQTAIDGTGHGKTKLVTRSPKDTTSVLTTLMTRLSSGVPSWGPNWRKTWCYQVCDSIRSFTTKDLIPSR